MTVVYPVIFTATHDKKDTYLIYIPDFNGVTEGYGLADAIIMARDYIRNILIDKKKKDFPKMSEKVNVEQSEFYKEFPHENSFISYVDWDGR